ncbi:hypothetical protein BVRB_7g166170 [Beta vulgaris subsp. vulgaris]|nr:hypothetical protein BVRB_7g166170 [Beta vulgaris subsp. vulgaris]
MPSSRKEGFDFVAYKLMENSGYEFSDPEPMGKVIEAKAYGLNETQQDLQKQEERVFVKKQWRRKDAVKVEDEFKLEKEVRSTIPSQMKRFSTLEVNMGQSLIVRGHTVVLTNQKPSIVQNEGLNEETTASCNHVTVYEVKGQDEEVETAPQTLEDGGQSKVDDLKKLSLGTLDEPLPIFVIALPTPEEEKAYLELLMEYNDVFAWSYREMPGLDPRVVVHR